MCLAVAQWDTESEQSMLEDIAHIRINGDIVELETLLGEVKILQAKVKAVDFMNSRIILEV